MTFAPFDVLVVPFPYSDRLAEKRRPALVVSAPPVEAELGRLWVVMITSDRGRHVFGDAAIADLRAAGLPAASILRASKVATIETSHVLRKAGRLADADARKAVAALRACSAY